MKRTAATTSAGAIRRAKYHTRTRWPEEQSTSIYQVIATSPGPGSHPPPPMARPGQRRRERNRVSQRPVQSAARRVHTATGHNSTSAPPPSSPMSRSQSDRQTAPLVIREAGIDAGQMADQRSMQSQRTATAPGHDQPGAAVDADQLKIRGHPSRDACITQTVSSSDGGSPPATVAVCSGRARFSWLALRSGVSKAQTRALPQGRQASDQPTRIPDPLLLASTYHPQCRRDLAPAPPSRVREQKCRASRPGRPS
jgi:hypothetical protein